MGTVFKKYIWVVGLLAIIATSFLLAKITALFIAGQFPEQAIGGARGDGGGELATGASKPADVQAILARNFFDPNDVAQTAATPTDTEQQSSEPHAEDDPLTATATKTSLSVKLISTVSVGDGRNTLSSAVISAGKNADVFFYNGKASFAPGTKITRILPKRVEFLNSGHLEYVELEDLTKTMVVAKSDKPTAIKKVTEDAAPEEVQAEGDKFTIARSEVDKAVANISKLYTDIRAVPYFKDGKADGFKLLSVKAGSLFEKLGLRRGDILKSLNGNTLDIQSGMNLFNSLKSESAFTLDIERRGADKTLSYDII